MSRLTRDGTAEPISRDQILRRERGQGNIHFPCFPCSADHEQDKQPYPVDPYSFYMRDHTYQVHIIVETPVELVPKVREAALVSQSIDSVRPRSVGVQ